MNALKLLHDIEEAGCLLEVSGEKLRVDGPEKLFTPEFIDVLRANKPQLLATLQARTYEGLTLDDLKAVAGQDWLDIRQDPDALKALARSIQTRRMRERGEVPRHYTSTTVCCHCGLVPIFRGVGTYVQGCPWCFNRTKGLPIPRMTRRSHG